MYFIVSKYEIGKHTEVAMISDTLPSLNFIRTVTLFEGISEEVYESIQQSALDIHEGKTTYNYTSLGQTGYDEGDMCYSMTMVDSYSGVREHIHWNAFCDEPNNEVPGNAELMRSSDEDPFEDLLMEETPEVNDGTSEPAHAHGWF